LVRTAWVRRLREALSLEELPPLIPIRVEEEGQIAVERPAA
jgi:hypothetical protein